MAGGRSLAFALLGLAMLWGTHAAECPVSYSSVKDALLFGGVNKAQCRLSSGKPCAPRNPKWVDACKNDPSDARFAVCSHSQRAAGLRLARQLHGGAPMKLSPCDLFPYLRGRTLWLFGDSHSKQLYKALQCFLADMWDGRECRVSSSADVQKQLDNLPTLPGAPRCIHLAGNGRICLIHVVLGTSLLNNTKVAGNGVISLLRDKGLAKPADVFMPQFGVWHAKKGAPGIEEHKAALETLGYDYMKNKAKWPYTIFRETPMTHDKDFKRNTCLPAPAGWSFDAAAGRLTVKPNARSERAALLARGGTLNSAAREILPAYGLPIMKGFDYSVPLFSSHAGTRGTTELDCLHYCSFGLPELLVYELARTLKAGAAGVKALPAVAAEEQQRLSCTPL